ncbi:MAG: DNA-binding response regulator [Calditrichaeota bacterium]|nr:MAG: DNA-binding response regulator [Calditrichota bacterium]
MTNEHAIDVALVEDNDLFRKTLSGVINRSPNLNCRHAFESAEKALRVMEREEWAPDIILLDIGLPGMNGIASISKIKSLSPASKIIMLTIHDDDDNVFRAICSGASGYLLKDASPHEIIHAMKSVLQGAAPMNAYIAKKVLDLFRKLAAPPAHYGLTGREKEILKLLVDGFSKKQIAATLFLSYHTVDTHLRNIYQKLEVHTRSGAVAKALKERLL